MSKHRGNIEIEIVGGASCDAQRSLRHAEAKLRRKLRRLKHELAHVKHHTAKENRELEKQIRHLRREIARLAAEIASGVTPNPALRSLLQSRVGQTVTLSTPSGNITGVIDLVGTDAVQLTETATGDQVIVPFSKITAVQ